MTDRILDQFPPEDIADRARAILMEAYPTDNDIRVVVAGYRNQT